MKKKMTALIFGAACLMSLITGCDKKNKVENYEDSDQEITTITFLEINMNRRMLRSSKRLSPILWRRIRGSGSPMKA